MSEMFSHAFIVRAVLTGSLVSLCCALLGVTLVLKRYSMIGDGLSHVGFGALSVALALNVAPLSVAVPTIVIAAFLLLRLQSKIKGDSAIALISSTSLAIGIIATSLARGTNMNANDYLFGSIFALSNMDVYLSMGISVVTLVLFALYYNAIFAVTFDEDFARASGVRVGSYNTLISILTAVTIVAGMKLMGTLLISSLIIFPALTSMRVFRSFRGVVIFSAIIGITCFFTGILASYKLNLPIGAGVVVINAIAFLLFTLGVKILKRR